MKTLNVTEVARNFRRVIDDIEREQEEIVLVRNHRQVARLVPEPPGQTADQVLGDLYRKLDDATADALLESLAKTRRAKGGTLANLRNPWDI